MIEKATSNYSAYSLDVPGCAGTGATVEETLQLMKEALEFHLEALDEIPQPKGLDYHINSGEWEFEKDSLIAQIEVEPIRKAA